MVEGNEHDEKGYRNEDSENREKMMEKRMIKLESAHNDIPPPQVFGNEEAKIGMIGCGSTFGPIQEAIKQLKAVGIESKFLQLRTLWPFPKKDVEEFMAGCKKIIIVENNYTGQLSTLLKSQVVPSVEILNINKYSSDAFTPNEISVPIQRSL